MSEKSPILLAGDDDQALYDFKSASPAHIRERHNSQNTNYASFTLPYCSRCTRVIVEATNDIIQEASKNGNLNGRINKEYIYFDDQKKDEVCHIHPNIGYSQKFSTQIPWFIEQQIGKIAELEKDSFSVLIISPTKVQTRSIVSKLKNKGFDNIQFVDRKDAKDATLLDGLKILLTNTKSNLGWRVVSKVLLTESDFKKLIQETEKENTKSICDLVDKSVKKEVDEMIKILKDVKQNKTIDQKTFDAFLKRIDIDPYEFVREMLNHEIDFGSQKIGNPGLRKIPIKATTIQSSKGLSADYVFITNFDDQYFIKSRDKKQISDQDICNLLVALTRAKKKVFLVSTNVNSGPTFLKWINKSRIQVL